MSRSRIVRLCVCLVLLASVVVTAPLQSAGAATTAWRWQNPLPRGDQLNDVTWIPGTDVVWAVGNHSCILKSADKGTTWAAVPNTLSDKSADLAAASFVDANTGFAVGALGTTEGVLLRTTDGASFTSLPLPAGATGLTDISAVRKADNSITAYAVGYNGTIIKTVNGGATWEKLTTNPDIGDFTCVAFTDDLHGVIVREGGAWRTEDGGATWTGGNRLADATFNAFDIVFTDANHGWMVGAAPSGNRIWYTQDAGNFWAPRPPMVGLDTQVNSIAFAPDDPKQGWMVGSDGKIWHTSNADMALSAAWTQQTNAYESMWPNAVSCGSASNVIFVGGSGGICRTTTAGVTWLQRAGTAPFNPAFAMEFASDKVGYAISSSGLIKTADGGETWTPQTVTGNSFPLRDVDFIDANIGWAGNVYGQLFKTTDGGSTWTMKDSGLPSEFSALSFVDADHGWVCNSQGEIRATSNGGESWVTQRAASGSLKSIDMFDLTHGIAVGANGLVVYTTNGSAWTSSTNTEAGSHLYGVDMVSATKAYMVGDWHGGGALIINVTNNGGADWAATPGAGFDTFNAVRGVSFSSPTEGWIVGDQGLMRHTTDGGSNWVNESMTNEAFLSVCSIPSTSKAWAGGFGGQILTNTSAPTPPATPVSVYRFYNKRSGTHFYTPSADEANGVILKWSNVFDFEGVCYTYNGARATKPLWRFYNNKNGSHFYTASDDEKNAILAKWPDIFTLDGPTYAVCPAEMTNSAPVWRFYNKANGGHFYTASPEERDIVSSRWGNVYELDGVAFYLPR